MRRPSAEERQRMRTESFKTMARFNGIVPEREVETKRLLFTLDFCGFESLHDWEDEFLWHLERAELDPEFRGIVKVEVSYIEREE